MPIPSGLPPLTPPSPPSGDGSEKTVKLYLYNTIGILDSLSYGLNKTTSEGEHYIKPSNFSSDAIENKKGELKAIVNELGVLGKNNPKIQILIQKLEGEHGRGGVIYTEDFSIFPGKVAAAQAALQDIFGGKTPGADQVAPGWKDWLSKLDGSKLPLPPFYRPPLSEDDVINARSLIDKSAEFRKKDPELNDFWRAKQLWWNDKFSTDQLIKKKDDIKDNYTKLSNTLQEIKKEFSNHTVPYYIDDNLTNAINSAQKLINSIEVYVTDLTTNPLTANTDNLVHSTTNFNTDEKTIIKMSLNGEIDWFGDPFSKIPISIAHKLKKKNLLIEDSSEALVCVQVNATTLPFQSKKMRQAVASLISRNQLIEEVLQTKDRPALGFLIGKYTTNRLQEDIKKAKILLNEACTELAILPEQLPPIQILLNDIEEHQKLCFAIGKSLTVNLGLKIEYKKLTWIDYFEAIVQGNYGLGVIKWYMRYNHPLYYLELFLYHSGKNTPWFFPLRQLVDKAKSCTNHEHYLFEAETILLEEMPIIPLFFQKMRYIKNPLLKNTLHFQPDLIDFTHAQFSIENKEKNE